MGLFDQPGTFKDLSDKESEALHGGEVVLIGKNIEVPAPAYNALPTSSTRTGPFENYVDFKVNMTQYTKPPLGSNPWVLYFKLKS
jgi:hypothetical protein